MKAFLYPADELKGAHRNCCIDHIHTQPSVPRTAPTGLGNAYVGRQSGCILR